VSAIEASHRSAEVRAARVELKRQVKAGEVCVSELLAEVHLPDWLHGMEIRKLLEAIHGVSDKMAAKLCDELHFAAWKPIGRMTYRQRRAAAAAVVKWERSLEAGKVKRAEPRAAYPLRKSGQTPRRGTLAA
jgi:hypothetical protein